MKSLKLFLTFVIYNCNPKKTFIYGIKQSLEKLQEIRELMGDEMVLNELANYASDDYLEEFVEDFKRSYDLKREDEE